MQDMLESGLTPNVVTYTTLMVVLRKGGQYEKAISTLDLMRSKVCGSPCVRLCMRICLREVFLCPFDRVRVFAFGSRIMPCAAVKGRWVAISGTNCPPLQRQFFLM